MNEYFVCIKVDREERPDVDQVYMNAVHLMKGQGGWPLNCFAMPDGRPVFGGTYFPPSQWKQTLNSLYNSYTENPQKFEEYANHLLNGIAQSEVIHVKSDNDLFMETDLHEVYKNTAATFDHKEGGFGGAPKFPLPIGLEFVLAYGQYYKNTEALDFLHLTLDKMAMGGIYDQIGGGFARYSVDNIWLAPHFEKMLYDNGQLISLYARAFKLAPKALYEKTIRQSLQYISREMTQEEGGFYSALDADSEGVEGKFYVWTKSEIDQVLGNSAEVFCAAYDISEQGNWEGHNIPMRIDSYEKLAHQFNLEESELREILAKSLENLLEVRAERVRPGLDDKILTSWNAIMLQGMVDAYVALNEPSYLKMAEKNANFLWNKLSNQKGKLYRTYKNGVAKIDAFLDDYALLIKAYVSLYQVTFKKEYLDRSQLLLNNCYHEFLHADSQMFFYTEEDHNLVARKMETTDNVIPAANSIMAQNLMDLGLILSDQRYIEHAQVMLQNVQPSLKKGQVYYANWDLLLMRFLSPAKEVVIIGEKSQEWNIEIQKRYSFNTVFVGSEKDGYLPLMEDRYQEGKSLIYVCENKSCKLPVSNTKEALELL